MSTQSIILSNEKMKQDINSEKKASSKQFYNLQVLACEGSEHHQHQQMHFHLFAHLVVFHLTPKKEKVEEFN